LHFPLGGKHLTPSAPFELGWIDPKKRQSLWEILKAPSMGNHPGVEIIILHKVNVPVTARLPNSPGSQHHRGIINGRINSRVFFGIPRKTADFPAVARVLGKFFHRGAYGANMGMPFQEIQLNGETVRFCGVIAIQSCYVFRIYRIHTCLRGEP